MQNARTYSDPEAYQSAIRNFETVIMPVARGAYSASDAFSQVDTVGLQTGKSQQPIVAHLRHMQVGLVLGFCPTGTRAQFIDGARVANNGVLLSVPGVEVHFRQEAGEAWANMSLPPHRLAPVMRALCGHDLPQKLSAAQPRESDLQHLRNLFGQAFAWDTDVHSEPVTLRRPTETDLLEAVALCLGESDAIVEHRALRRQRQVMSRFREFLDRTDLDALQISDLCAYIGVGERTFRMLCEQALGTGPMRYVRLHRFMQARAALRAGRDTSVTAVALRYGFAELGRFAGEYARLFGELPSVTLKLAQRRTG